MLRRPARRFRTRRPRDQPRYKAAPGRGRGTSTCDSSPVDRGDPMRGHADVARVVGVAVDDARLTSDEPRPGCSASSHAFRRHRTEVDLRPGLRAQEVGDWSEGGQGDAMYDLATLTLAHE